MSREAVRQAFKTAIEAVYTAGPVYISRSNDNREDNEFCSVYISDGDIQHNFSDHETELTVVVKHAKQGATDAALDSTMQTIIDQIEVSSGIATAVSIPLLESFEYDEESEDMPSLKLIYKVLI